MRSRYSAFCLLDSRYLLASWHEDTRPAQINLMPEQKWLGLKVVRVIDGTDKHLTGIVEYIARYKISSRANRLHEVSHFERIDNVWYYKSGDLME